MAAFRLICCVLLFFPHFSFSIPEPGKNTMIFEKNNELRGFSKALYKDATISAKGKCTANKKIEIYISWKLKYTQCADQFITPLALDNLWNEHSEYELKGSDTVECNSHVHLADASDQQEYTMPPTTINQRLNSTAKTQISSTIVAKRRNGNEDDSNNAEGEQKSTMITRVISPKKKTLNKLSKKRTGTKKKDKSNKGKQSRTIRAAVEESQDIEDMTNEGEDNNNVGELQPALVSSQQSAKRNSGNTKSRKPLPVDGKKLADKIKKLDPNAKDKLPKVKDNPTALAAVTPATDHQVDSNPSKKKQGSYRIATARRDGIYLLIVNVEVTDIKAFEKLELEVSMESKSGYLSATDWPLLPFYGIMSLVYLFYGLVWFIVSACQWRDLLRIQFWIGGVIALGMLEKAVFYSEYNNINNTGIPTPSLVIFAEVVSVAKRTLARMLVIIVSMGFGIVKPRLGKSLHRVLGVGALYFILAVVEGCMRALSFKADPSKEQLIAGIPLAVLDAAICWWIFMSLVQTTRTLRIRRNVVKLSLYRHFTNTLIFAVLASVAYMIWSIKTHKFAQCLRDWSELWLDEAFWHFLFSIILLVIMVLWRPTANNQRYAFTPIVDFDDDNEEDNVTLSEAFDGMKMRNTRTEVVVTGGDSKKKAEDDLKWVEENIPSSAADTVLPSVLDSDEELMTTKFEMSKMD